MRQDFRFDGGDHGLTGNGSRKKYVEPTAEELKLVTIIQYCAFLSRERDEFLMTFSTSKILDT